jgi:succinate dehydrogenase / fumarate reductase cytochrome b subunit
MPTLLSHERLKRIHALAGLFPLGVFVVVHLGGNATALWGRERFEEHLAWVEGLALRRPLEVVFIFLPLLVHAAIGIRLLFDPTVAAPRAADAPRDWGRIMQRATGLLALVFIAVHLGHYRLPRVMGELSTRNLYDQLSTDLGSMRRFAFYLAGTSAVVFHLAHGTVRFVLDTVRRPQPLSEPRRRRVVLAVATLGVLLWLVSLEVLGHYYAGGSFLGGAGFLGRLAPQSGTPAP